MVPVANIAF